LRHDRGREDVYSAEIAAFAGTTYESLTALADLVVLGRSIDSANWWPHGEIEVVAARSDARSSSTRPASGSSPVIRLAADQMTPATLVHEFAHALAGVQDGHGPVFRKAHVDLVRFAFGNDEATWLLKEYSNFGVSPGVRCWPRVPSVASGAIAL
jgi:hypothetical protein